MWNNWFFGPNLKKDISIDILKKMNSNLHHRGPDDEGYWFDEKEGLYFGHKRLSIIDLSKKGSTTNESSNKNYIICYNGEIYNFQKIKDQLIKEFNISFQGKSDTEILLEAINFYGLKKLYLLLMACMPLLCGINKIKNYFFVEIDLVKTNLLLFESKRSYVLI